MNLVQIQASCRAQAAKYHKQMTTESPQFTLFIRKIILQIIVIYVYIYI